MKKVIQLATQYLISAQHSFVKNDDPYKNCLNFCLDNYCVKTKNLSYSTTEITLQLNYIDFSLEWTNSPSKDFKLVLNNRSHREIISWISKTAPEANLSGVFKYISDANQGFSRIRELFVFRDIDRQELNKHLDFQLAIQKALKEVIAEYDLQSQVHIWGEKQETALYALLNPEIDLVIHLGMSPINPLSMESHYHIYAIGWQGSNIVAPKRFPKLQTGNWHDTNWHGALMPLQIPDELQIKTFFRETIGVFGQHCIESVA